MKNKSNDTPGNEATEPTPPAAENAEATPAAETTAPETPAEPAAAAEPEVALMSDHELFRSMSMPTQNAVATPAPGAENAEGTEATGTETSGATATGSNPLPTDTPSGQPAGGTMGIHTSNVSATAAVGMFDFLFAIVLGMVLSKIIADDYRASDGEKNELAKALAPALAASNIVISPWYNVILVATAIYGPKAYKAYNDNQNRLELQAKFDAANRQRPPGQQQQAAPTQREAVVKPFTPPTAPAAEPFTVKAPEQPIINTGTNCPTCNSSVAKGKRFCDRDCAARFEVDKRRIQKNQQPMYIGLPKAEADKVARQNAPKKSKSKTSTKK